MEMLQWHIVSVHNRFRDAFSRGVAKIALFAIVVTMPVIVRDHVNMKGDLRPTADS